MRTSDNPCSYCIIGLLMRNRGADERTRTAYPCSLRVIGHVLLGVARVCKSAYLSHFLFPGLLCVAPYCVRVVSEWYQFRQ